MTVDSPRFPPGGSCLAAALLVCAASACAGRVTAPPPEPLPVESACAVVPTGAAGASAPAPGSPTVPAAPGAVEPPVVVGVSGAVDLLHAPMPTTPAEEVVFAHLYETLVRIDCTGQVRPAIAESWSPEQDGRAWTFRVRADVRDWRGELVTAHSVATSLSRPRVPAAAALSAREAPAIEQLTVLDAWTLRVVLGSAVGAEYFARPELAVTMGLGANGWPIGTGVYRPAVGGAPASPPSGSAQAPRSMARPSAAVRLTGPATVDVRSITGDVRDALEAGVDLWVAREPTVIEYAEASPEFEASPLAWDRAYVLVSAAAVLSAGGPTTVASSGEPVAEPGPAVSSLAVPPAAATALARDAVRIEARAAAATEDARCPMPGAPAPVNPSSGRARRIVYPASDPTARSLAERLVALALAPERPESAWLSARVPELTSGGRIAAAGLGEGAFEDALHVGSDAAFVVPVRRGELTQPCDLAAAAAARAPWLIAPTGGASGRGPAVLPLLETRSTLVVREGIEGIGVGGSGALRLERLRRVPREGTP